MNDRDALRRLDILREILEAENGRSVTLNAACVSETAADLRAALISLASPSQTETPNADNDVSRTSHGLHTGGTGGAGVASGDVSRPQDVRSPEKRCLTFCGWDRCDCAGINLIDPLAPEPWRKSPSPAQTETLQNQLSKNLGELTPAQWLTDLISAAEEVIDKYSDPADTSDPEETSMSWLKEQLRRAKTESAIASPAQWPEDVVERAINAFFGGLQSQFLIDSHKPNMRAALATLPPPERVKGLVDAAENFQIAVGMGWDLDGVNAVLTAALASYRGGA